LNDPSALDHGKLFCYCPAPGAGLPRNYGNLKRKKITPSAGGSSFAVISFSLPVNIESRIASRVLWQIATDRYRNEDDIYRTVLRAAWTDWFDRACTIRVDVSATKSPLTSLNFVTP